jgi:hypothetical protein
VSQVPQTNLLEMKSKITVLILGVIVLVVGLLVALNIRLDKETASLDLLYESINLGADREQVNEFIKSMEKLRGFRRFEYETDEKFLPGPMPLSFILIEYEGNKVSYVGILSSDRHDIVRKEKGARRKPKLQ